MNKLPLQKSNCIHENLSNGEFLILDLDSAQCHALSADAGVVWLACDGQNTSESLVARFAEEHSLESKTAQEIVAEALEELTKAGLISDQGSRFKRDWDRRTVLKAAALLPWVASVLSPTPAMAASTTTSALCAASTCGLPCSDVTGGICSADNSSAMCSCNTVAPRCCCISGTDCRGTTKCSVGGCAPVF